MSEYQYYEFVAVDRPLSQRQMGELRGVSTRARITPTSFVNTYQWGDLKADPRTLVERYFDAFLYLANWGTRRVVFRLPARLLDLGTATRYCAGGAANAWAKGGHVLVDLVSENEEGYWDEDCDGEGRLASVVPVRAALAAGDLRPLYLAWLLAVQADELDDDAVEPPVPPGLGALDGPLRGLVDFLRIDEDLLAAAAAVSGAERPEQARRADLVRHVRGMPVSEKDDLLLRLVDGDVAHARAELLRRAQVGPAAAEGRRRVGELLDAARASRAERERLAAQRRAEERARRERAEAAAREERLNALASRQDDAWRRVDLLIDSKRPAEYDTATALLVDLRDVAERQGRGSEFGRRVAGLREQHRRKVSLIERLDRAGVTGRQEH